MIVASWLSAKAVRSGDTHPLHDAAWVILVGPFAAVVCLTLVALAGLSDWWEGAL